MPLDTVRRNQSRQQAGANGGTLANNQWGANRPFAGCGAPRTPIRKLYTTDVGMQRTTLRTARMFLLNPPIEGRLAGGFEGMDVGHKLRVRLVRTDVEHGYIDFTKVV